jgi:hypothetical protein
MGPGPVEDGDDCEEVEELHDGVVLGRCLLWEEEDVGLGGRSWVELGLG